MKKPSISVIVPVYNGEAYIEKAVSAIAGQMGELGCEILIAEDGSYDNTAAIVKRLMKSSKKIRLISREERAGKGKALSDAIKAANGEAVVYLDADLATPPSEIRNALSALQDADIVVGSRLFPGRAAERKPLRGIFSRAYNILIRLLFASKIHDHQCGFKAFRKGRVIPLLMEVEDEKWFWDTELLLLAQKRGYTIREIPVGWEEKEKSTFNLFPDSAYMLFQIARFYLKKSFRSPFYSVE